MTRQITGVAAGTNNTDAVNVAQLKALESQVGEDLAQTGKYITVTVNEGTQAQMAQEIRELKARDEAKEATMKEKDARMDAWLARIEALEQVLATLTK